MSFAWPHLLFLLALPAALLAWELSRRRRLASVEHPKILRAEAGLRSVSLYAEDEAPAPLARRRILLCAGLALGAVALARPQWGSLDQPVFDQSREIIIALDLSRSMLTPDVKPARIERAKLLIQSLLDRLRGERVGLIVFSGTAFLQSPPSADYEILREFLPAMGPDFLPEGGTNYGDLLDAALDAFGEAAASDRFLVILSDGEATDEGWRDRIPLLAKRGIRVIGLGVGTASGGMIPDGSGGFMKDERGAVVLSKLESATLRDLAGATHGAYRDASEWVDLPALLSSTVEAGRKGRFLERDTVRRVERYQWALAQALICLAASFWLEFPVRPRPREIRIGASARPRRRAAAAAACLAALLLAGAAGASGAEETRDPAAALSKIVGRLCAQDSRSAVDWAEMASETVTWGRHIASGSQNVPEGPVRDALAAVDLGSRAGPKAADWGRLRTELEKLLEKPEDKKQQEQQKQQQQQNQQQQQDKRQDQQQKQQQGQQGSPQQASQQPQGARPQQEPPKRQDSGQTNPQSAFGSMGRGPAPTPTPAQGAERAMQRVGGERKDQENDPARKNPELAVPLEKLDQLRSQDSPAELFGLLRRGEPTPPPVNNGKNW
jgi:Ca-activated chloride channel family protein